MDILTTDALYYELVIFSLFLLFILLYNNIVLYKMGFSDKLTLLLLSIILMSLLDAFSGFVTGGGVIMVALNSKSSSCDRRSGNQLRQLIEVNSN